MGANFHQAKFPNFRRASRLEIAVDIKSSVKSIASIPVKKKV